MLVREISEKEVKFLQNPWTNKPEKGVIFNKSRKRGVLKCWSSNEINGCFSEKRVAQYQSYQRKGFLFILKISEKRERQKNIPGQPCLNFFIGVTTPGMNFK